ncbi:MAG: helix-turn-helix transcriptional regulator, partial [Verrucomicrobiae bacterium]|nr:helix-turn-helix transcriptional regulator [Verrucomicrobiae bacterium]
YLARGKLHFAVDRKSWRLESGHLTITRPWQEHRVGNPHVQASRLHWLILDVGVRRPNQPWRWPSWLVLSPSDLRRLTEMLRHNEQPVWAANAQLGRCFEQLAPLVAAPDPRASQTWLQLRLNELFVALYEMLRSKRVTLDARLTSTRRTVEMFLASLPRHLGRPWTLDEMARECGLARTRFAHYCQRITNLTPAQYLMRCRLEEAARLLRGKQPASVTDAAYACGFSSSQYFATVFRRRFGCRPSDYRARGGG